MLPLSKLAKGPSKTPCSLLLYAVVKRHIARLRMCRGRSQETAYVEFATREEAERARDEYNGVKLDNKAMDIVFSEEALPPGTRMLSSGLK